MARVPEEAPTQVLLTTPLSASGLVTPRQATLLSHLGLTNVGRLIAHLPMRHERLEAESSVEELVHGAIGSARGEITAVRVVRGGKPRVEAVLMDHTARLDLVWFNQMYRADQARPGVRVRVQGKAQRRGHLAQMVNPTLQVLDATDDEPLANATRLRPVYPASEEIGTREIERVMQRVAQVAFPLLEDHLPEEFRSARQLPTLREAYRMQHAPKDEQEVLASRRRLAYDELLLLQLGVQMRRAQLRERTRAPALTIDAQIDARIRARFPFMLTAAQERVIREVRADLALPTPTNRLIQGDVGSGKTIIALDAMLACVASGHQACLLAPTQILAEQHFATFSRLLAGSRVRVALLTGASASGEGERNSLLARLGTGEIDILLGTHAILGEDVRFASLALAIIDEQHRFGVAQRARLRSAASDVSSTPHVVVMTATPIPRSLSLTLFGDLDVSTIDQLPPGRTPIVTSVLAPTQRRVAYEDLRARIEQGQQGYIVVPAISPGQADTSGTPLVDVETTLAALASRELRDVRLAALHGDLPRATRDAVMERFRLGQIQAIVATTVVEVGVDVPNATVMIVEQADRFGLSQLHQLRGRVGRGVHPSICYLIAEPATEEGAARLAALAATTDGFVLAEKDLELRGMGEVFGTKQAGVSPFRVADPLRDRDLLLMARRDASAWIGRSPFLDRAEEAVLRRRVIKTHGAFLGLADVG
jgi:ATP-dependent DNA helicase RecG